MNRSSQLSDSEPDFVSVTTSVLWTSCALVGLLGMYLDHRGAPPAKREPPPAEVRLVHVELTAHDAPSPPDAGPPVIPTAKDQPPPPPRTLAAVPAIPLIPIVTPTSAAAFIRPVQALQQPKPVALVNDPTPATPRRLKFGQGEGRQPSPEYPREAQLAHQQGEVLVRFVVGEDGRVQSAEIATPCSFPILNHAALRGIRESWRFSPGAVRNFEVTIVYTLKQR